MDAPEHTRYRRLLTRHFSMRRMTALTPRIEAIVEEHLDAMARQGPPADLVRAYALPIPSLVICELLGVPYAERDHFREQTAALLSVGVTMERFREAITGLGQFLYGIVRSKRVAPTDDLLSELAAHPDLTEEELTGIAMLLLVAGHETTANMLALGTYALLSRPDQLAVLRADPALIDNAVEELLRYLSIVHVGLTRTALTARTNAWVSSSPGSRCVSGSPRSCAAFPTSGWRCHPGRSRYAPTWRSTTYIASPSSGSHRS